MSEVLRVFQIPIKQGVRPCRDEHFGSGNLKKVRPYAIFDARSNDAIASTIAPTVLELLAFFPKIHRNFLPRLFASVSDSTDPGPSELSSVAADDEGGACGWKKASENSAPPSTSNDIVGPAGGLVGPGGGLSRSSTSNSYNSIRHRGPAVDNQRQTTPTTPANDGGDKRQTAPAPRGSRDDYLCSIFRPPPSPPPLQPAAPPHPGPPPLPPPLGRKGCDGLTFRMSIVDFCQSDGEILDFPYERMKLGCSGYWPTETSVHLPLLNSALPRAAERVFLQTVPSSAPGDGQFSDSQLDGQLRSRPMTCHLGRLLPGHWRWSSRLGGPGSSGATSSPGSALRRYQSTHHYHRQNIILRTGISKKRLRLVRGIASSFPDENTRRSSEGGE
ncbi:unnamed protein product [Nesidiocoris tenuis]|uniref:Uncharacterized protein n=1 Tax=Nesidiocoris tenuis TaxID=355587 RepID=A0A6H5GML2_9HEMI|nr:unnamed protein product [Nesidiocoris tenuis]